MVDLLVILIPIAVILFVVGVWAIQFTRATGSAWQRLIKASMGSATILWSYAVALGAALVTFISAMAEVLGMPEVKEMIEKSVSPEFLGLTLIGITVITIIARLRTILGRDSDEDRK